MQFTYQKVHPFASEPLHQALNPCPALFYMYLYFIDEKTTTYSLKTANTNISSHQEGIYNTVSQPRVILHPMPTLHLRRYLSMSGGILGCHKWRRVLLDQVLLNIPQSTGWQTPTPTNDLAPNVNSLEVVKI